MTNKIILEQLKKVSIADLSNFDKDTNTYYIPKKQDIKLEEDKCYFIKIRPEAFNNETLVTNWNKGNMPSFNYLKIDIGKIMNSMIKVNAIGVDELTMEDKSYFWNGWLDIKQIEVLKKL